MKRREFIAGLGGAVAWPLAVRAQRPNIPLLGLLGLNSRDEASPIIAAVHQGLSELGYSEGRNFVTDFRWADGRFDRLPALATELVRLQAAVIFTNSGPAGVRALKDQTTSIPIVFAMGEDPVKEGLVESLNRPGGNVTGFVSFQNQLAAKRLALLYDSVPKAGVLGFLVNPAHPNAEAEIKDAQAASRALRRELRVFKANTERAIEATFPDMIQQVVGALSVSRDAFFFDHRRQLVALTTQYSVPAIYDRREFPAAGGLMSYGTNDADTWRQSGVYIGRLLNGEKPSDLPIVQSTRFDFVINLKSAKVLGLEMPPGMLALADEVIEDGANSSRALAARWRGRSGRERSSPQYRWSRLSTAQRPMVQPTLQLRSAGASARPATSRART
jgi:putative tryptophan/tyrosine transport system substrate-binding protein